VAEQEEVLSEEEVLNEGEGGRNRDTPRRSHVLRLRHASTASDPFIFLRIFSTTMTDRIYSLAAGLFLVAFLCVPPAHGQRIGYANQEALLANMPGMSEVQKKLQQAARQQQQQLQKEQKQLQRQMQQYQQQQSLLSDSAQAERERELRQRQQQLQKSSRQRQQQLRKRERELMQPLLEELQTAIETVASEENVDVVLRTQALLDVNESSTSVVNLSPAVAEELGIQLRQTPQQPSPTVQPQQGGGAPATPQGGPGQ